MTIKNRKRAIKGSQKEETKQDKNILNMFDITSYQNYANDNNEIFFIIQIGKDKNYLAKPDISEEVSGNLPSIIVNVGTN